MADRREKTVSVPNISCGHCVRTIEQEVGALQGVSDVKAEADARRVTVGWDPEVTDWEAIERTMLDIDYPPAG